MNFQNILNNFRNKIEKKSDIYNLAEDLQKELNIISRFAPFLEEKDQRLIISEFMGYSSFENTMDNPMIRQMDSSELQDKMQAPNQVKRAMLTIIKNVDKYVSNPQKLQSARVDFTYQEFKDKLDKVDIINLANHVEQFINEIKNLQSI